MPWRSKAAVTSGVSRHGLARWLGCCQAGLPSAAHARVSAEEMLHDAQSLQQGSQGAVVCFFDEQGCPVAAKMMKGSKASAIRSEVRAVSTAVTARPFACNLL